MWGSKGGLSTDRNAPWLGGVFKHHIPLGSKRHHQTEKPLGLMQDIIKIVEPHERILDPFCGSGTTLLAAKLEGYSALGIEKSPHYAEVARDRLDRLDIINNETLEVAT